jgi:sugar phosphate isomerase/epimerase
MTTINPNTASAMIKPPSSEVEKFHAVSSNKHTAKPQIALSTDTLGGCGLDLIFSLAKDAGFDGLDLAIYKNYDARNDIYVAKLSHQYELPIISIQTSNALTAKELGQAIALCTKLGCTNIVINPPTFFDLKTMNFIQKNLAEYQERYADITFHITNPDDTTIPIIPIPKYRFGNLVEIIKQYNCHLALDMSNISEKSMKSLILPKLSVFMEKIKILYISDRDARADHIMPGE